MGTELGFDWMPIGAAVAAASGLCLFLIFKPSPQPPPSNAAVFGCYSAVDSPSIKLDSSGMHILQANMQVIGFRLERHKTGIVLVAQQPIFARLNGTSYRFGIATKGEGKFLPFFWSGANARYGVVDERNLQNFEMLTDEGAYLLYRKVGLSNCKQADI